MENKRLYSLIGQVALNYRVSLINVCRLLGKSTDEKTRLEVYEAILSTTDNKDVKYAYDYLFNYETVNESLNNASLAYNKSVWFLKNYTKAQQENNKEEIHRLNTELVKIEKDFNKLLNEYRTGKEVKTPSLEEITIISRYRIKHRISQNEMISILGITRKAIYDGEKKIESPYLLEKLQMLSNYFQDTTVNKYPRKR